VIAGLDHVQLAIPRGGEETARAFYGGVLGLVEREKPVQLIPNGGLWFEGEGLQLHLGVEADFAPARKAHVAFIVRDLDGLGMNLRAAGSPFEQDDRVPGRMRAYTSDPFGNRIELIADGDGFSQRR
jgi:catechol 2,3-dioxygenase-like lactoylglutathione lyase family enzyme